jgi:periplasmic protein CpxP/Spy
VKPTLTTKNIGFTLAAAVLLAMAPFFAAHAADGDAAPASSPEGVELRIKELHDRLKISKSQEDQWGKIGGQMRDHAKAAHELALARQKNATSMTAVQDLQTYAQIAQVHADGMKQFLDLFAPLYDGMSDDQKKTADSVFRDHKEERAKKHQKAITKK